MPERGVLHLHNFGSRFIPHLPCLPLCSVFLDLPPPSQSSRTGQRLLRRSIPEGIKRKVLLIGTADGLYVAETRRRRKRNGLIGSETLKRRSKVEGKKKDEGEGSWNDDIRCRKVSSSGVMRFGFSIFLTLNSRRYGLVWEFIKCRFFIPM